MACQKLLDGVETGVFDRAADAAIAQGEKIYGLGVVDVGDGDCSLLYGR